MIQPHAEDAEVRNEFQEQYGSDCGERRQHMLCKTPNAVKCDKEIELGEKVICPVLGAKNFQKTCNHPGQYGWVQIVRTHPFLAPSEMHHAVRVELMSGQRRDQGP